MSAANLEILCGLALILPEDDTLSPLQLCFCLDVHRKGQEIAALMRVLG